MCPEHYLAEILIGSHGLSLFHNQTIRQTEPSVGRVVWTLSAWKLGKKKKKTIQPD